MSDPLADLAKTLSPSDPQTPVPPPSGPTFIFGIVNTVNKDGTVLAALNGSTGNPSTVLCGSDFVPVVGQKIMVLEQGMVFRGIAVVADSHTIGGGFTSGDVKTSIVNADQPGWWVMDGRSTTALAQPALAAALRKTGTFNIPNAIGRFLVHADGATYTVLGVAGSDIIQPQNLPATSPYQPVDPTHGHAIGSGFITGTGGTGSAASAGSGAHADNTVATATGITLGTNTAGGGQAFNPPWLGVIYLIKL